MTYLLVLAAALLAYSNGANDNFKGVASLFGSRSTGYRTALWWGTLTTFAGSICAIFLAQTLLIRFSGNGLVPSHLAGTPALMFAVAAGAGITVAGATVLGLPVSTTHALTGALAGSGIAAAQGNVNPESLGRAFLLPLALSPVLAAALAASLYVTLHFLRLRLGVRKEWCICVGEAQPIVVVSAPASAIAAQSVVLPLTISTGDQMRCAEQYSGVFSGIRLQTVADAIHFVSAGMVSFARGLNDTPKIAALLLGAQAVAVQSAVVGVAIGMAIGGLLSARKVATTMSHRITSMNHGQGLAANLSTGALVILASTNGLPVSTTHVAVGSLFGIGFTGGGANLRVVRTILASWVLTLPCGALLGALVYGVLAWLA
jgi:PiT family inorganic phosphate transporter